jgi:hypothetical protein
LVRFVLLAVVALMIAPAHAESTARIVDTYPAADALLGHNESFYVRIGYATDEPISLWARPYRNGQPVEKAMSNASAKYTGEGEALGWFALIGPGEVDEIRILAGGGKPYREWELTRQGVQLTWSTANPTRSAATAWVEELKAAADAHMREDAERRANEPVSLGATAFFSGFMLLMFAIGIAGVAVPLWCVWKWRGGWRLAAAIPAAVVVFVVLRIVIDTARDPTSHNLWPFELLMVGTGALVAIGALKVVRRMMRVEA